MKTKTSYPLLLACHGDDFTGATNRMKPLIY